MNGRIFLAFLLGSFFIAVIGAFFWETLNQRLFIPLARWLRFKKDDTEKVEKKVEEILGEKDGKKDKSYKSSGK